MAEEYLRIYGAGSTPRSDPNTYTSDLRWDCEK